jgi:hypothetical protein
MMIKHMLDVTAQPVVMDGAKDVTVRVLVGPQDNARPLPCVCLSWLRRPHPFHAHNFEHEVIILEGDVAVMTATA